MPSSPSPMPFWMTAMSAVALLLVILAPTTAWSQDDITIGLNDTTLSADTEDNTTTINLKTCRDFVGDDIGLTIGFLIATFPLDQGLEFAIKLQGDSSCEEDLDATDCEILQDSEGIPSASNGTRYTETYTTNFAELFGINSASECEDQDTSAVIDVIAETFDTATNIDGEKDFASKAHSFILVTARPNITPPTISNAAAGESSIQVSFTEVDDADSYNLYYGEVPFDSGTAPDDLSNDTNVEIGIESGDKLTSGIAVNKTYTMALVAVDSAGNETLLGETLTVETKPTLDFYEQFRDGGGGDEGGFGCQSTPASGGQTSGGALFAALTLIGMGLVWRRRSLGAAAPALAVAVITPAVLLASAGTAEAQLAKYDDEGRLPTSGAIELRMGVYLPEIDSGVNGSPYKTTFGNESMFLTELQFDSQFYNGFGTAGVGLTVGLMDISGKSIDSEGNTSVDKTELNLLPMRLSLVYRFDVLAVDLDLPIVPVFKAGLDYYIWWITSGQGDIATFNNGGSTDNAIGGTLGWHASMGIYLLLDWFDEVSADTLLFDFGIANTYLFADFTIYQVDDFGSSESFNFSDQNVMFGIAFEY